MGFIMDGVATEAYDRSYTDGQLLRRIFTYFRPHLKTMVFVAAMTFLDALMGAALPVLISRSIDVLGAQDSSGLWQNAVGFLTAILLAGALAWTFNFFRQTYTAKAVGDVVLELRKDAFDAVLARDMSFYDEFSTGKIVSRVTSDTQDFATVVTLTLNLMSQVLQIVIIVGVLFYLNVRLTLIALVIAPFIVAAALAFRYIARFTAQQARRVLAEVNANVQESVTGISVAKAFRQEATVFETFNRVNKQSYDLKLAAGFGLQFDFSHPRDDCGRRHGAGRLLRRAQRLGGRGHGGRVVLVCPERGAVLVSADQHRLVLEPVSAGLGGQRARLRPGRRRAARGADRV